MSCQQIRDMLSDCTALDEKIHEQYIYLNELAAAMQNFIKENAMHPQSDDFYNKELAAYEKKKADGEAKLNELQSKKASRLSRKELLDGLIRTLETADMTLPKFDEKLCRFMVESVTVGADSKLTFRLRNGLEITVE